MLDLKGSRLSMKADSDNELLACNAKIEEVEQSIAKCEAAIEKAASKAEEMLAAGNDKLFEYWSDEKKQLRDEKKQLRDEKKLLLEKEKLLLEKKLQSQVKAKVLPS